MKAIFKVQWRDGTPQMPDDISVDGVSAIDPVTVSGLIRAQIEAPEKVIEALKGELTFVDYIGVE